MNPASRGVNPRRSLTEWTPPLSRDRRSPLQSHHGVTTGGFETDAVIFESVMKEIPMFVFVFVWGLFIEIWNFCVSDKKVKY
jgi:hypothetical protein